MSDQHASEPWWGDESPVGTDRRRPPFPDLPDERDERHERDVPHRNGVGQAADHAGNGVGPDAPPYAAGSYDPGAHGAGASDLGAHGPAGPDAPRRGPDAPRPQPTRSSAQVFVPAPEDLPPFEEVVDPIYPRPAAAVPDPGPLPDPGGIPDPGPLLDVPPSLVPGADQPPTGFDDPPPAPDLSRPVGPRRGAPSPARPRQQPVDRRRLAVVYDVEGPRVRLGIAWFLGAMAATIASPFTAAVVFAAAAGLAARQVVRAWGSVSWQADLAAGLGAVPVLAALVGTPAVVVAAGLVLVVATGAACAPDGPRLPGGGGRLAAMGILSLSVVPAVAGATFVLVRAESVVAGAVLLLVASAYEVGDYIVGSGASNPVEGPLAGATTATLVSLPLALVLVEPYDAAGVGLLGFAALACPLGQVVASAALPGAGAYAPALRRIDTLIVLAPLWAAAAGAF